MKSPKVMNFDRLQEIKDSADRAFERDSIDFTVMQNKTMADSAAMLGKYKDRERLNKAVQLLKKVQAAQIAYDQQEKQAKQKEDSLTRAELDNYLKK